MAFPDDYRPYGGTTADLAVTEAAVGSGGENVLTIAPDASFDVYDAASGGEQVTDLCDDSGAVISAVVADGSGNLPRFWAPNTLAEVWLDNGTETRRQAMHADLGSIPLTGGGGGEGTVTSVNGKDPDAGGNVSLSAADVGAKAASWTPGLADLPTGSMLTVDKSGGTWPTRPTSRTDVIIRWRGVAPGPNIDGTYALNGVDDWDEL